MTYYCTGRVPDFSSQLEATTFVWGCQPLDKRTIIELKF